MASHDFGYRMGHANRRVNFAFRPGKRIVTIGTLTNYPSRYRLSMRAEIISIGDELTSGQRLDTNSQWLSERLGEIGIPVFFHTTVADDLEANVRGVS